MPLMLERVAYTISKIPTLVFFLQIDKLVNIDEGYLVSVGKFVKIDRYTIN